MATASGKPLPRKKIIPVCADQRKTSRDNSRQILQFPLPQSVFLWKQYSFDRRAYLLFLKHSNFKTKNNILIFSYAYGSTWETLRNLPWTKVLYKYKVCNWHLNDPLMISYWGKVCSSAACKQFPIILFGTERISFHHHWK